MADNVVLRLDHNLRDTRQDMRHLNDEMGRNKQAFDTLNRSAKQSTDTMTDGAKQASAGFANLRSTLVGLATVGAFAALAKGIVDTTSRYEDLRTTLTTVEQSSAKAARAFDMLNKLAAATPFSVESLTESYIKLRNRGLQPTEQDLIALGDLAASQGKELDQVTEAMLDALTGENERLKEFGIQASKAGDQVTFAFKGVQTTVAATPEAIQGAILAFGRMDGVAGGMAARSQTLSGQVSTLRDNLAQLGAGIGAKLMPGIKVAIEAFSAFAGWIGRVLGISKDLDGSILEQTQAYNSLFAQLKMTNAELAAGAKTQEHDKILKQERSRLVREINDTYGEYLPNLLSEKSSLQEINKLQQTGIKLLTQSIVLKANQQELEEMQAKTIQAQRDYAKAFGDLQAGNYGLYSDVDFKAEVNRLRRVRDAHVATLNNFIEGTAEQQAKLERMRAKYSVKEKTEEANKEDAITKAQQDAYAKRAAEAEKARQAELKRILDLQKKFAEETKKLELSNQMANMEAANMSSEQRRAILEQQMRNEINALELEAITTEESERRKLAIREKYAIEVDKLAKKPLSSIKQIVTEEASLYDEAGKLLLMANARMVADVEESTNTSSDRIFQHYADKAAEFADYAGNLGKEVLGFVSALQAGEAARTQQQLDAQVDAINTRISDTEASVARLNEAAAAATGQRQTELLQQAALQAATIDGEKRKLEELDATRKRVALQQAKREKAVALAGAVINTAQGVTKVLATTPTADFGIARAILIATTLASGFAQVASIAAQPLPQFRHGGPVPEGGGLLRGPRHSGGGIPLEAEGGEWIFSREKTRQFRPLFEAIQDGKVNPQQMQAGNSQPRVDSSLAPLADALRNLKQVHVNLDAKGFRVAEQTAQSKTNYLNSRYRA
jgi:hypothetical protein